VDVIAILEQIHHQKKLMDELKPYEEVFLILGLSINASGLNYQ
jgi:hypothetical protein